MLLRTWLVIYKTGILLAEEQKEKTEPDAAEPPQEVEGRDAGCNKEDVGTHNTDGKSVLSTHISWNLWHCLGSFYCTEHM